MNADQSLVSFSRNVQETVALRKELAASKARIAELEEWIKRAGVIHDECTYPILKRVCHRCRCDRFWREKK